MKLKSIDLIDKIKVHWSESNLINDELGCDDNCDIEKEIAPDKFDDIVKRASKLVNSGYDKTLLSVYLKNGTTWAYQCKFYLNHRTPNLLKLLNLDE